ncbi:MAG TPA: metallophosphoesterase family protein [Candidatus Acidoferrales bacterium]|jgi:predicted phosphodiesterase
MRFLVLSDIHANSTALAAALAASEGRWERCVCLGDLVGYGPDPNEVVGRVRDLVDTAIRGNHDKAVCGVKPAEDFNPAARAAVEWTRSQLLPETLQYLCALPAGPVETDGLTLVHGAIHDEDEYVFTPAQALDGLLASPSGVTFFGHTHFQGGFSYREGRLEVIQLRAQPGTGFAALRLESGTRYLLNPGSIGQPRDGDPRAAFAIADLDHEVVEFWRVPYDVIAVQQRMHEVGAAEPLVSRLTFGR